ncbi:hypothetical protein AA313_de0209784 [Arthrobotrys entomopaga]|nr:hypothetical protein AA313_de0209784 [Arthrobotrys entomopaga]
MSAAETQQRIDDITSSAQDVLEQWSMATTQHLRLQHRQRRLAREGRDTSAVVQELQDLDPTLRLLGSVVRQYEREKAALEDQLGYLQTLESSGIKI